MGIARPLRTVAFVVVALTAALSRATLPAAASAVPGAAARRTLHVPILMYHRIDEHRPGLPEITRRLTVDPHIFAKQTAWLKAHGRHAITQKQLCEALTRGRALPSHPVLITFDDGYSNVFANAMPVLVRLHMPATAYVITERISGPDPSFLTWRMLRALERNGVEIGSHTVTHRDLTSLRNGQALGELVKSKRTLERRLGHRVPWLAYPFGGEDPRIVGYARRAGYALAVTTHSGSDQHEDDLLRLPRYEVVDTTGVAGLAALVS